MIQERIKAHYPHHLTVEKRLTTEKSIYVADHSLATQGDRNVELVDDPSQVSIEHFTLNNPPGYPSAKRVSEGPTDSSPPNANA